MKNLYEHLPKSKIYPEAYVISIEEWPWGTKETAYFPANEDSDIGNSSPMELTYALNKDGHYIGDPEWAATLYTEYGIVPELRNPDSKTCSIGKGRDGKWYGWSHRAIYGFEPGSSVTPGHSAYKPSTVEEMYDSLYMWHDTAKEMDMNVTIEGNEFIVKLKYAIYPKGDASKKLMQEDEYRTSVGVGAWTAHTDMDAKRMAEDFAESVSSNVLGVNTWQATADAYLNLGSPYFMSEQTPHSMVQAGMLNLAQHPNSFAAFNLGKYVFFSVQTDRLLESKGITRDKRRTGDYECIGRLIGFQNRTRMTTIKFLLIGITYKGKKHKVVNEQVTFTVPEDYPMYISRRITSATAGDYVYSGAQTVLANAGCNVVLQKGDAFRISRQNRNFVEIQKFDNDSCCYKHKISVSSDKAEDLIKVSHNSYF